MTLDDLPTPCLVLDLGILKRNLAHMQAAITRHPGVVLRPHMKTAKSLKVAELAAPGFGPITVSTLAEAQYFFDGGWRDQIYAVGMTPQKLDQAAALGLKVITDDADAAAAIAAHPGDIRALVEIDVGEGRGGVPPDEALALARILGPRLAGIFTHAGHSYAGRSEEDMRRIAEQERGGAAHAAQALRDAGIAVDIVSLGSSPTALYAQSLAGITEVRAGVYMFGDLFQAQLGTHGLDDIAMTVLASVIGRKPARGAVLLDAGGLAMSKDRSTAAAPVDYGFGLMLDLDGTPSFGQAILTRTHQEHGEVSPAPNLPIGAKVRVAPNHTCMTAAAHPCYHLVDGGREVIAVWDRVNGW
ncbi:alanine racemase [Rhodovarius sp.]|uniref:alanine racemase n=1 Tax=Rhodovarius sp. TaxID=2972673 RepID=UPI00334124F8